MEWMRSQNLLAGEPLTGSVSAISVGIVNGVEMLDLAYVEDSVADVDMNIVCTGDGKFVEIQGTAEHNPFDHEQLNRLLDLGGQGCAELARLQKVALGL